ncbi:follicle cell protein 3C-1 [Aphidius gifuensis]|uniref:follicle cell protein 3C-1 n=1 Tax=Aphidius gifuensis TaxID=684658 RepID=UPI001CDC59C7|nr:follicle cell protein 3C-1 [Aphidius gifuensis]
MPTYITNLFCTITVIIIIPRFAESNQNLSLIRDGNTSSNELIDTAAPIGCLCGVFLSGSFKKFSKAQPFEPPALIQEHKDSFPCTLIGNKLCTSKCLDVIVKYLPNSPAIICGSIERDCVKERAYLFIKNCDDKWINTNLSAGREYCCKDGIPYKCPTIV